MRKFFFSPVSYGILLSIFVSIQAHAQTEGFNIKTPIQNISDSSSQFIKQILTDESSSPGTSIPKELICGAECILIIPTIRTVPDRNEYGGTGLLGCIRAESEKPAPPIFYRLTNIETFEESGGGLVILVTDRQGVKTILGDQLQLSPQNTGGGVLGSQADVKSPKTFIAYVKPADGGIKAFDASGSTLVYDSGDTFKAYQQDLDPIDIMLFSIDVPPALRGFNSALEAWRDGCK